MHIALFCPAWPLDKFQNGIVTYVHWLKPELERAGHRVSVFVGRVNEINEPNIYAIEKGLIDRLMSRLLSPFFSVEREVFSFGDILAKRILQVHRHDPIDVIEMEESFGWFAAVEKRTRLPLLVKLHGPAFLSLVDEDVSTEGGITRIKAEGAALASSRAIAAPCEITLKQTLERYDLNPVIAELIHNPVSMDENIPKWRLDTCDKNIILFVGRFDKRKGADVLLEAFNFLAQSRPLIKLIFVGPDVGVSQDDGSMAHFDEFCDGVLNADVRRKVKFLGSMSNSEIPQLRCEAMVTVVASRWENPGYTALEAMYQCCPVVCSDAGGCAEIIDHGRTGLLARSGDAKDFAAKIATMLDFPQLAMSMGLAARADVVEKNSARNVAERSIRLYERVIADHRTPLLSE